MIGLRAPWHTEGGVERVVGELAPRLVARGCEVTVYCRRRYNALGPGMHHGVRLVDIDTLYTRHLEAIVHTALATPRALVDADLIHIHATGPSLMSWMPRLVRRPTVVTLHGLDWQRQKWGRAARLVLKAGARSAATFPHKLIAVGEHLQTHYEQTYGVSPTFIPNGVSPIPPVVLSESGIAGLTERGFLLFVGRLVPEKGLERLMAGYAASGASLPLVIAGGATHMDDYADKLARLAPPGVMLVGPKYGAQRDALLSHARAFVLPSLLEGFPLAALEAMEARLPVLLSDIPPHRELLSGAPEAGWLISNWADGLSQLAARGEADLRARGAVGQQLVRARYSWDQIADQTLDVYEAAAMMCRT